MNIGKYEEIKELVLESGIDLQNTDKQEILQFLNDYNLQVSQDTYTTLQAVIDDLFK